MPRRLALITLLSLAITSASWAWAPERAFACTGGPPSPVNEWTSALIVGRVTNVEYLRRSGQAAPPPLRINVTVEIEHYLWGSGPSRLVIVDDSSAQGDPDDPANVHWIGPCRAFAEDPTGKVVVLGVPSEVGEFSTVMVYGLGDTHAHIQPGLDWVEEQIALSGVTPASAGFGVEQQSTRWPALGLGVLAVELLAGGRRVSRR